MWCLLPLVLFVLCFAGSSSRCQAAVIYLEPNYPNQVIPDTNWSSRDFSNDPQGVVFAGALAENSTLEIKNIRAKKIEVNATYSRGCTLRIEHCVVEDSQQEFTLDGGIVVAPTIFAEADGRVSCSRAKRKSLPSLNHEVNIAINHNIVKTLHRAEFLSLSKTPPVQPHQPSTAAIAVYNLIVCQPSSSTPYSVADPSDVVSAKIHISNNVIDIKTNDESLEKMVLHGVAVYWMPRVDPSQLELYARTILLLPQVHDCELFVPLQQVSITENQISIYSSVGMIANNENHGVGILIGFENATAAGWASKSYYYLYSDGSSRLHNPPALLTFNITANNFSLDCNEADVFLLGTFGNRSSATGVAAASRKVEFNVLFVRQSGIRINASLRMSVVNVSTAGSDLVYDKFVLEYVGNDRNVMCNQYEHWKNFDNGDYYVPLTQSRIGIYFVIFAASTNSSALVVQSSSFNVLFARMLNVVGIELAGDSTVGLVKIKSVAMNILDFNRTYFLIPSQSWWQPISNVHIFRALSWRYVGNFVAESTIFNDTSMMPDEILIFYFVNVTGASSLTQTQFSTIEGAFGLGVGDITVRDNLVHAATDAGVILLRLTVVPRVGNVLLEGNRMIDINSRICSLIAKDIDFYSYAIMGESLVVRNNTLRCFPVRRLSDDLSAGATLVYLREFIIQRSTPSSPAEDSEESYYIVEDNIFVATDVVSAYFVRGAFMADPSNPASAVVILRNNYINIHSTAASSLLNQNPESGAPPRHRFNVKKIIIRNTFFNASARRSAGLVSSSFMLPTGTATNQMPDLVRSYATNVTFIVEDTYAASRGALISFAFFITNNVMKELRVVNATLIVQLLTGVPPAYPPSLGALASLVSPELKFSILTKSSIGTLYLAAAASTKTTSLGATKPCSTYNGKKLTDDLVVKLMQTPIVGFAATMYGDGRPTTPPAIEPGVCALSPTTSATKSSEPTVSRSLTQSEASLTRKVRLPATVSATPPIPHISISDNGQLPGNHQIALSATASLAALASIVTSPLVAVEAGKTMSLLATISRCRQYQDSTKLAEGDTNEQQRGGRIAQEFVANYLSRDLSFPESIFGMCLGGEYKGSPRCVRGAVVGGYLFVFLVGGVLASAFGFAMARKKISGSSSAMTTILRQAPRFARYPFVVTNAVAVILSSFSTHAITFLAAPSMYVSVSDRLLYGVIPLVGFWFAPAAWFCIYLQRNHLSRASGDSRNVEQNRSVLHNPNMTRADEFHLEKAKLFFPTTNENSMKRTVQECCKSKAGKFLVFGDATWSQGSTRTSVANGAPGSFLINCGSVVNKFLGPMSRDFLVEFYESGPNSNETNKNKKFHDRSMEQPLRNRLAPFTVFIGSFVLVIVTAAQAFAALNPSKKSCVASLAVTICALFASLLFSALVRPQLVPFRNYISIFCDALVVIAAVLATIAFALEIHTIITVAQAMLYCSLGVTILSTPITAARILISALRIAVVCTRTQYRDVHKEDDTFERPLEMQTRRRRHGEAAIAQHGTTDASLMSMLLLPRSARGPATPPSRSRVPRHSPSLLSLSFNNSSSFNMLSSYRPSSLPLSPSSPHSRISPLSLSRPQVGRPQTPTRFDPRPASRHPRRVDDEDYDERQHQRATPQRRNCSSGRPDSWSLVQDNDHRQQHHHRFNRNRPTPREL